VSDYAGRVLLALEGLVPVAWMDRVHRHRVTFAGSLEEAMTPAAMRKGMFPSDEEREQIVGLLVMADTLAAGGANTPNQHETRGKTLAALAKAITIGALMPGGIKFLGQKWEAVDDAHMGLRLEESAYGASAGPASASNT
jgi:hypothetical protein